MIFHEQDPLSLTLRYRGENRSRGPLSTLALVGNVDGKLRALIATGAFRRDRSSVRLDQRLANCQTEPETTEFCPAALLERVENFRQRGRLNAGAGIGHLDSQLVVGIIAAWK